MLSKTSSQEQSSQPTSGGNQSNTSSQVTSSLSSQSVTSIEDTSSTPFTVITKKEAKKVVLDTLGVRENETFDYEIELDTEKGL